MNGIQYRVSVGDGTVRGAAVLGALRAGGYVKARIDSGNAARLAYLSGTSVRELAMVPVRSTGQDVTSTHMNIDSPAEAIVWGNGDFSATANPGGTTTLTCTSCHNPHGNGQYRILNPIPAGTGGTMTASATSAPVDDAPLPSAGDARNYTVMQKKGTEGTPSTYLLYASDVVNGGYADTVGDYFHRRVPWNASTTGTYANDAPNGKPTTFNGQINLWCAQCHSRYLAITGAPFEEDSGDAIFKYRHSNTSNKPCTTCHVAHGSNAQMTGVYSSTFPYPNGTDSASSRLLKIDNRGTCQACHDPTGTTTAGTYIGPSPSPVVP